MASGHTDEQSGSNESQPRLKKAYLAPQLVEFGTVRQLALAGTGSVMEGPKSVNAKKHP